MYLLNIVYCIKIGIVCKSDIFSYNRKVFGTKKNKTNKNIQINFIYYNLFPLLNVLRLFQNLIIINELKCLLT